MPEPYVLTTRGSLDGADRGDRLPLSADADHHVRRVLRLTDGDRVLLGDGAGTTAPALLTGDGAELTMVPRHTPRRQPALHVVHALPKGRKLDEVVRVLTELGVDRLTPVASERSVVRLDGAKADKAVARWRAVASSALGQSRGAWLPEIDPPGGLDDVLAMSVARPGSAGIVAHVGAPTALADALEGVGASRDAVRVAVGPEGGWTDGEITRFAQAGWVAAGMGPTVLRTEHAAATVVAILSFTLRRMG